MKFIHAFRFRLSTLFILITLLAWASATQPFADYRSRVLSWPSGSTRSDAIVIADAEAVKGKSNWIPAEQAKIDARQGNRRFNVRQENYWRLNPRLLWPTGFLVAFLGWKSIRAWRLANPESRLQCRRRRPETGFVG